MITFITAFKPFVGSDKNAQKSALYTWAANGIKVIACDVEGDAKGHCGPNVTFAPNPRTGKDLKFKCNAPLVNDLLKQCLPFVKTDVVGFVNSDILIKNNFNKLFSSIVGKYGKNSFLVGTRFDIDLNEEIKSQYGYADAMALPRRIYDYQSSSDIFITSKSNFLKMAEDMPDFVLGRYAWDNWIHYYAQVNFKNNYNCTHTLLTLHCQHTHNHIEFQEGKPGKKSPSAIHNMRLMQRMRDKYGSMVRVDKWPYIEV